MKEIDYSDYFWQDDMIRLRGFRPEDWENHYLSGFETSARLKLECAMELPPTMSAAREFIEENVNFKSTNGQIYYINGEYKDAILYGLTKDEFSAKLKEASKECEKI
ncbi:hypothetical protein [Paenibacillus sp.]|jgi:hypothetical protein|uniref:hypothetical protein n=1 Tax=Paenibacillus sp. TaxID=58172 RepID=UPI002836A650|nr:hypothetical protein [Paenibacillus sp.]MDR0268140.1 hypothetical protein [Paenibacillus sp.]